jgi:hypothetical protein
LTGLERLQIDMNELIRLAFRIVVLGPVQNGEELYQKLFALLSPLGGVYDFKTSPYPKIAGSQMWVIEFDIPRRSCELSKILELIGGTGWHRSEEDGVDVAIWAEESGALRPLSEYVYWVEIQMIPHIQLSASRRASP